MSIRAGLDLIIRVFGIYMWFSRIGNVRNGIVSAQWPYLCCFLCFGYETLVFPSGVWRNLSIINGMLSPQCSNYCATRVAPLFWVWNPLHCKRLGIPVWGSRIGNIRNGIVSAQCPNYCATWVVPLIFWNFPGILDPNRQRVSVFVLFF